MKKLLLSLFCVLAVAASAFADTWTYQTSNTNDSKEPWTILADNLANDQTISLMSNTSTGSKAISWTGNMKGATGLAVQSYEAARGLQLGIKKVAVSSLSLSTTAFKDSKISKIDIVGGCSGSTYSVKTSLDTNKSGTITSGSDAKTVTLTFNPAVNANELTITLTKTTTAQGSLYLKSISIEYSEAGPVDPAWTLDLPKAITYGESYTPAALNVEEGLTVAYTVTKDGATEAETPNADGSYLLNAGTYNVSATSKAVDGKYNALTKGGVLTVAKKTPEIAWNPASAEAVVGEAFTAPVLTGLPEELKGNLIYVSTNEAAATISNEGVVTILAEGTTNISALAEGNDNYNDSNEATYTLKVNAAGHVAAPVFSIENNSTVKVGTPVTISSANEGAVIKFSGTFTGEDEGAAAEAIAETTGNSIILNKAGMWELSATATVDDKISEATAASYIVEKYAPTLAFQNGDATVETDPDKGSPAQNIAVASGDLCEGHAPVINYKSSDENIATVNEYGSVTITGAIGKTTITATLVADEYYEGKEASYIVDVKEPVYVATFVFKDNNSAHNLPTSLTAPTENWSTKSENTTLTIDIANAADNKYCYTSNQLRIYKEVDMIISTEPDYAITSIEFDGKNLGTGDFDCSDKATRTPSNGATVFTWTPEKPSSKFTFTKKTSGGAGFNTIKVNLKKLKNSNLTGFENAQSLEFNHDGIVIPGKFAAEGVKVNASIAPAEGAEFINPENNSDYKNFDKEAMMADLMAKDSYLYDGTEEKAGYLEASLGDANENLTVTVPCSGKYVVTLTLVDPDGDYIPVEPVTCPVEVYPSYAGLHINYNPVNEDGNCYVDPAKAGKARLGVDAMFCTLQYRLSGASSEQSSERPAIRRAAAEDDGFLTYPHFLADGDGVDLSNGTQLEVRLSKNGTQSNAGGDVNGTAAKTIFISNNPEVGVEGIESELGAEPEYYTLQGVRVSGENLQPGIYVVRAGNKTYKVLVK